MANRNYTCLGLGLVLMALSSIKFYNQPLPPNSTIMVSIYDFLHGYEIDDEDVDVEGDWLSPSYNYTLSIVQGGYYYSLNALSFEGANTVLKLTIAPSVITSDKRKEKSVIETEQFSDFVLIKHSPKHGNQEVAPFRKTIKYDSSGNMLVELFFPMINRSSGRISIYRDRSYTELFSISTGNKRNNQIRSKGTNIWGVLFCIGFIIMLIGLRSKASGGPRKMLLNELNELDKDATTILQNISLERVINFKSVFPQRSLTSE